MTELARTLKSSLTENAFVALYCYTETAAKHEADPRFDGPARYGALLEPLIRLGGTWADVKALLELHEPALAWANRWHARTVWVSRGGSIEGFES